MSGAPRLAQVLAGAPRGGAENFFTRLVTGLHEEGGLDQRAFIRPHPDRVARLRRAGVPVSGFRFPGPLRPLARYRYRRALAGFRPDRVLTWMNRASAATPPGPYTLISRLGHYYDLKYYRHADYWIGITRGICDHLVRGGMPAARVAHLPNFADETPVTPLPRDSFDTPAGPLLLAAGRLHHNKGFDVLLRALARLPDATLWLAGTGPERSALHALATGLGVAGRVRFLGWRDDVTTLMASVDVFVCPSRHEGLGSIVLEAWAHGCPIVATASQGPAELIRADQTGLLTPVDRPEALAGALRELLADDVRRRRLADAARRHYQARYSRRVVLNGYRNFFAGLPAKGA
ncbi:group 1 glycosyl transferase [Alcanivorax sp. 521-1]|uniref:Group 1 glycosyl transferase n=1 Tax=Alloalcanivorax profundimaris TaxID=2735259 RepID=A0ABS0ANH7_9GAMM|nr:glycosyltransferase [Alloalcanivorax profundimaris]MBF5055681.1 group 1 glycosyl transferase [Alloalcanivorax profundimaris]